MHLEEEVGGGPMVKQSFTVTEVFVRSVFQWLVPEQCFVWV